MDFLVDLQRRALGIRYLALSR